jgi:hypothetical protein
VGMRNYFESLLSVTCAVLDAMENTVLLIKIIV